jgi:hypothetical protein
VVFEFADASGMSTRTTDKDGVPVAWGDGGEGSPIETDPLGGSVGTHTPYITIVPPYDPDPNFPDLIPFRNQEPGMPGMDFGSLYSFFGSRIADLPGFGTNWGSFVQLDMQLLDEMMNNALHGRGYNPNEQIGLPPGVRLIGYGWSYDGVSHGGGWTYDEALRRAEGQTDLVFANWDEGNNFWDNPDGYGGWGVSISSGAGQQTNQTETCVFNINLKVPKEWNATDRVIDDKDFLGNPTKEPGFLMQLKSAMQSIFANAGLKLVFNDSKAASGTKDGNFTLSFVDKFSALGKLAGGDIYGWRFGERGEVSYSLLGKDVPSLAEVGVHEASHEFLEHFDGLDSNGHGGGIMVERGLGNDFFTAAQAAYLKSLCNKKK